MSETKGPRGLVTGASTQEEAAESTPTNPRYAGNALKEKTVEELREVAAKKDIEGRSSMKKDELVEAIAEEGEA